MEIFDILALLIILLAFVWPLVQAVFLRRRKKPPPSRVEEIYTALYPEEVEEEVIEPIPEPEPAVPEPEPTSIEEWELTSQIDEIEADLHYLPEGVDPSRVRSLLSNLPSKGDMVLLHEILSPPKSLS